MDRLSRIERDDEGRTTAEDWTGKRDEVKVIEQTIMGTPTVIEKSDGRTYVKDGSDYTPSS